MQKIRILIFFSVLLCLCSRKENILINSIDLLAQTKGEIINISEIASDVDYTPLQTTDSSLVGAGSTFKVKGNYFYIGTMFNVLCFDKSGKYLFKLDKNGRGPGEYEYLMDFEINQDNTILLIKSLSKVLLYKQTEIGFVFMNQFSLPTTPSKITFIRESNNLMLQYSNDNGTNPYSMELINLKGESLITWPNYMKYTSRDGLVRTSEYENTRYYVKSHLFLKELQNDTLFCLTDVNTLEPFLIFNTRDKRLTPEARSNGKYYTDHFADFFHVQKIFASERYIYYSYYYDGIFGQVIYDQISKNKYSIPDKVFLNDDLGGGLNFEPQYCDDGIFYTWVESFKLKEYASGEVFRNKIVKNPVKKIALKRLADSLKEFDNPVMISAKGR